VPPPFPPARQRCLHVWAATDFAAQADARLCVWDAQLRAVRRYAVDAQRGAVSVAAAPSAAADAVVGLAADIDPSGKTVLAVLTLQRGA
jgi:hypothetical protein